MLREMSLEDDQINAIIEAHTEVVNSLKDERDRLKDSVSELKEAAKESAATARSWNFLSAQEENSKIAGEKAKLTEENEKLHAENDALKAKAEKLAADVDTFKAQAEKLGAVEEEVKTLTQKLTDSEQKNGDLEKQIEDIKGEQEKAATLAAKESAYKEMLKEAGVSKKRIDSVIKVTDFDKIEIDEDGKLKDKDKIVDKVKADWADFIEVKRTDGADTKTPPDGSNSGKLTKEDILKIKDTTERQQKIAENHELFGF